MSAETYIEGSNAKVSSVHVIALRVIPQNLGYIVQALTVDWAIDLEAFPSLETAQEFMTAEATKLNHR